MSGFFYRITGFLAPFVDYKSLTFPPDGFSLTLPEHALHENNINILDTCNGLVLCGEQSQDLYDVCNPALQTTVTLPTPPLAGDSAVCKLLFDVKLMFDPRVSHHFKVVRFSFSRTISGIHLEIFSSETMEWVEWAIPCESSTLEWFPSFKQSVSFVHGVLFLSILPVALLKIDVERWHSQLVEFPRDAFLFDQPCLGMIGEDFHLACQDRTEGLHIQVFKLIDDACAPAIWNQIYRIDAEEVYPQPGIPTEIHLKAFHLNDDVIFQVIENKVYAYHLESKRLEDLDIELHESEDIDIYPFSPCALNAPRLTANPGLQ
ncbi:hypothetical protein QJS04_geneDACA000241 [Acorus gramineus]|uniref:F-box protein At3g26010-like beta-propeller domain-containing protein n=1 Tax=Acorus gramineus TaxID=55184 RepID=A0AAV9AT99_ACOGR|nr:hypothetical protein QJS04_geneDACA000241 [Acorus gramineus]